MDILALSVFRGWKILTLPGWSKGFEPEVSGLSGGIQMPLYLYMEVFRVKGSFLRANDSEEKLYKV